MLEGSEAGSAAGSENESTGSGDGAVVALTEDAPIATVEGVSDVVHESEGSGAGSEHGQALLGVVVDYLPCEV